jgi:hypothetical protein
MRDHLVHGQVVIAIIQRQHHRGITLPPLDRHQRGAHAVRVRRRRSAPGGRSTHDARGQPIMRRCSRRNVQSTGTGLPQRWQGRVALGWPSSSAQRGGVTRSSCRATEASSLKAVLLPKLL